MRWARPIVVGMVPPDRPWGWPRETQSFRKVQLFSTSTGERRRLGAAVRSAGFSSGGIGLEA